jgi:hypothetical protein
MKVLTFKIGCALLYLFSCSNPPSELNPLLKEDLSKNNLITEEMLTKFNYFDFSSLFMMNDTQILGFIGDDFQRFEIKYLSIIKKNNNPNLYYVYGKSKVRSNICSFLGEIEIKHIRKYDDAEKQQLAKELFKSNDLEAANRFSKQEYVLLATYQFFEDPGNKETGVFIGDLKMDFYFNNENVWYNDLDLGYKDGYSNNQCTGTWTEYGSTNSKICNWGEFRIPLSGDLDIGTGEFCPNEKYRKNGWQVYYEAFLLGNSDALKEERRKWW